jgi:hypothetical protein
MILREHRAIVGMAILISLVTCGAIITYFQFQPPVVPDLAALASLPVITPSIPASTTPQAPVATPGDASQLGAPQQPGAPQPTAEFDAQGAGDRFTATRPDQLLPEMFAFDSLPFDAPVAVFPIVLVDQKVRSTEFVRDMEIDPDMSPDEASIIEKMRVDMSGPIPRPGTTPGTGPTPGSPGEESASRL